MKLTIHTQNDREPLGDLYGIFFEDINYAADGGLYAELVQNRAFEYSSLDNAQFRPLYAWEKLEKGGKMDWMIEKEHPVSPENPHYLVLNVTQEGDCVGVRNTGYNQGICVEAGKRYRFSCYVRNAGSTIRDLSAALTDAQGNVLCSQMLGITMSENWIRYETALEPKQEEHCGRL